MPTIVIRRACFISLLSAFRITEWFQAPPGAASGTARPGGTKTNPQRDLPVIARTLGGLGPRGDPSMRQARSGVDIGFGSDDVAGSEGRPGSPPRGAFFSTSAFS